MHHEPAGAHFSFSEDVTISPPLVSMLTEGKNKSCSYTVKQTLSPGGASTHWSELKKKQKTFNHRDNFTMCSEEWRKEIFRGHFNDILTLFSISYISFSGNTVGF